MSSKNSFIDMVNDKVWLSKFYEKLYENPLILQFDEIYCPDMPEEELSQWLPDSSKKYSYAKMQIKLRIINKEEKRESVKFINLLHEVYEHQMKFITVNQIDYPFKDVYIYSVLFSNIIYRCFEQRNNITFLELFFNHPDDVPYTNFNVLFDCTQLQQFYNSKLKDLYGNFLSRGANSTDRIKMFFSNEIIKKMEDEEIYKDHPNDLHMIKYISAFFNYCFGNSSSSEIPSYISAEYKLRKPSIVTSEVLKKFIQYRNIEIKQGKTKRITLKCLKFTAEHFSDKGHHISYTRIRDWMKNNRNVFPEWNYKSPTNIAELLTDDLVDQWFEKLK